MKKLEVTLSSCNDCPYLMCLTNDGLHCGHDDAEGNVKIFSVDDGFPDWCPVQDKDPGVKVGLTAMIVRDGKILLGKRINTETAEDMLAYPGGRMDYAETPEEGVIREIFEETGLRVDKGTMRYLTFKNERFTEVNQHYVSLIFIVTDFDGEPETKEPEKCAGWDWYDPFDLPENTFWAIKEVIDANQVYVRAVIVDSEIVETLKQLKD